jgi:hypothetical protein
MKIYTPEEAASLPRLKRGRHTLVHKKLYSLQPGHVLFIEKGKHWVSKTPPHKMVRRFEKKHKMKFDIYREENGKGWFVEKLNPTA